MLPPATTVWLAGESESVKSLVARALLTVTVMLAVLLKPSLSVAIAAMVWLPLVSLVVSQLKLTGEVVPLFLSKPSIFNTRLESVVCVPAVPVICTLLLPETVAPSLGDTTAA